MCRCHCTRLLLGLTRYCTTAKSVDGSIGAVNRVHTHMNVPTSGGCNLKAVASGGRTVGTYLHRHRIRLTCRNGHC